MKFDKAASSIGLTTKHADADEEDTQSISTIDSPSKVLDGNPVKKPKQTVNSDLFIEIISHKHSTSRKHQDMILF